MLELGGKRGGFRNKKDGSISLDVGMWNTSFSFRVRIEIASGNESFQVSPSSSCLGCFCLKILRQFLSDSQSQWTAAYTGLSQKEQKGTDTWRRVFTSELSSLMRASHVHSIADRGSWWFSWHLKGCFQAHGSAKGVMGCREAFWVKRFGLGRGSGDTS